MTKKTRRRVFSIVFYFAVLALTLWYVFQDENLSQIAYYLSGAKWGYAAIAVAAGGGRLWPPAQPCWDTCGSRLPCDGGELWRSDSLPMRRKNRP